MNVIFLGAPGSGKGTQSAAVSKKLNIPIISTGDLLRKNVKEGTPRGLAAKSYMDKGELVPADVVLGIIKDRLDEPDCRGGVIFDGYPRSLEQAETLAEIAEIDKAVYFEIDLKLLTARLSGRRICEKCGEIYNAEQVKDGACKKCGGALYQRKDDRPETIASRMEVFKRETEPLIGYYRKRGLLHAVNAADAPAKVTEHILGLLKNK